MASNSPQLPRPLQLFPIFESNRKLEPSVTVQWIVIRNIFRLTSVYCLKLTLHRIGEQFTKENPM